ncbi:MAG TPA: ArsR family transcriptional regulator [Bacteroidia bacterium]|nr:ArsR family transcriptional regulator [Bacteroidia bacterium]
MLLDFNMLDTLITSKTRVKLLLKFFLNSNSSSYLRALEEEFDESSNAIRVELNRFEEAGLLVSETVSNRKVYRSNTRHPLFKDIHSILLKYVGLDHVIGSIIEKIGDVRQVYLIGDFARGINSDIIDLMIVTEGLDKTYLLKLVDKAEKLIKRKIRYLLMNSFEADIFLKKQSPSEYLLLWQSEG